MGGLHGDDPISQHHVSELNRQQAQYRKALKHAADYSLTTVLTTEEQLAELAATKPEPQPAGQSLRLVTTPLDGQEHELERRQTRRQTQPANHRPLPSRRSILDKLQNVRPPGPAAPDTPAGFDPYDKLLRLREVANG